jgi:hypothetical protein
MHFKLVERCATCSRTKCGAWGAISAWIEFVVRQPFQAGLAVRLLAKLLRSA